MNTEEIEKRIDSLPGKPVKKTNKRKRRLIKRSVVIGLALLIAGSLIASAALLGFYGTVETTANVSQSVLLDGGDYLVPLFHEFDVTGGCGKCVSHTLENTGCEDAPITIDTQYSPDGIGITTTYLTPLGYSFTGTSEQYDALQYYPVDITVEDGDCEVTWTFDMVGDKELQGNGHWGYGLAIGLEGEGNPVAFQIHNNDGTDSNYAWGTHLYSPYYDGSWHSGDTNTPVSDLGWVSCTGERYNDTNPDGIFTVTISKCKLGEDFHWAVWFGVGGFYSPNNGYSSYPEGFCWDGTVNEHYEAAALMEDLGTSFTIQEYRAIEIVICYRFDIAIVPDTYIITTQFQPTT